jgi:hypothetical protein
LAAPGCGKAPPRYAQEEKGPPAAESFFKRSDERKKLDFAPIGAQKPSKKQPPAEALQQKQKPFLRRSKTETRRGAGGIQHRQKRR